MTAAILIAGPTASGKTALALELARTFHGTVVNADSMQVYAELRVLTARPTAEEEAECPHRLFGHVSAAESYSVGRWLGDAAEALQQAHALQRLPIFVGGTGLYFRALTQGLAPVPDIPETVRRFWRAEVRKLGGEALQSILSERDPAMASKLRASDPQRLVRALEVIDATGVSLAEWQAATGPALLPDADIVKLVLAPERQALRARIGARFDAMLAAGAVAEVEALLSLDLDPALPAMRAHGVREISAYLDRALTLEEAAERAKSETRRYAKRQMTWARRYMADWQWYSDARKAVEVATLSSITELKTPDL
jgi:tRNA dimethylallyltransferase